MKILPLVEYPPGARHWVEFNILILLFYLSLRSWEVKQLDLPIGSKWQRKIQTLVCLLQCPCFLCLSWLEAQIMDQVKGNVLRAMKIANIVNDKSLSVISKSNSFCSCWSLFDCKSINVNYFSKCLEMMHACTSASTGGPCFLKTLGEKYKIIQLINVRLFLSWGFWFAEGFPLIGMGFSSPSFPDQLLIGCLLGAVILNPHILYPELVMQWLWGEAWALGVSKAPKMDLMCSPAGELLI